MQNTEIQELINEIEFLGLKESLSYIAQKYESKVVFTSSFGQEDQVIADAIFTQNLEISVITLDTGRLFQETYDLMDATRAKYKVAIKPYFPNNQNIEKLTQSKGFNSFYESVENRKECCFFRKIEPLKRALAGQQVWITGLRAEQSENRNAMALLEWDDGNNILKFNPLIHWSYEQVLDYLKINRVPDNPLHRKGFVSIGCQPCTRAIAADEHPRAGRWWWENSKKECGLH